jgi:hypothetical protein
MRRRGKIRTWKMMNVGEDDVVGPAHLSLSQCAGIDTIHDAKHVK